jgi:hypothetical protein
LLEIEEGAHALALDVAAAAHYQLTENEATRKAMEEARRRR